MKKENKVKETVGFEQCREANIVEAYKQGKRTCTSMSQQSKYKEEKQKEKLEIKPQPPPSKFMAVDGAAAVCWHL